VTDWLVYRCDDCHQTHYVNLAHETLWRPTCGHRVVLVDASSEETFKQVLKGLADGSAH
jgi:hypothetical protein